jgi:hypothetical protein
MKSPAGNAAALEAAAIENSPAVQAHRAAKAAANSTPSPAEPTPTEPSAPKTQPAPAPPDNTLVKNDAAKQVDVKLKSGKILKLTGTAMDFIALAHAKDHDDFLSIAAGIVMWRIAYLAVVQPNEPALIRYLAPLGAAAAGVASGLTTPFLFIKRQPTET